MQARRGWGVGGAPRLPLKQDFLVLWTTHRCHQGRIYSPNLKNSSFNTPQEPHGATGCERHEEFLIQPRPQQHRAVAAHHHTQVPGRGHPPAAAAGTVQTMTRSRGCPRRELRAHTRLREAPSSNSCVSLRWESPLGAPTHTSRGVTFSPSACGFFS